HHPDQHPSTPIVKGHRMAPIHRRPYPCHSNYNLANGNSSGPSTSPTKPAPHGGI
ncbi:hypothetical protein DFQ29_000906, partial [Apophysomyces sp. BC1021]